MKANRAWSTHPRFDWRVPVLFLALSILWMTTMRSALSIGGDLRPAVVIAQERTISVWDGVYTEQQARRGESTYRQECSSCHYDDLQGQGSIPALVGSTFFFQWGDRSIDELLTAIRTTMPQGAPASLGHAAYLDVIAYMLQANGIPPGDVELPNDREQLRQLIIRERSPGDERTVVERTPCCGCWSMDCFPREDR